MWEVIPLYLLTPTAQQIHQILQGAHHRVLPVSPRQIWRTWIRLFEMSAECYSRLHMVNFNSFDKKANNGGHLTLHSFNEYAAEMLLLSGLNQQNEAVSCVVQVNITGPIGRPRLFDIKDCKSNRRNKTKVSYESNGESMEVKVISKTLSLPTINNYRLVVKLTAIDTLVPTCSTGINCFLEA